VFFFQAEDGIRDKLVTGVQTCALPIYKKALARGVVFPATLPQVYALMEQIEEAIGPLARPKPCHNDLLASNFIDDGQRIWILDWEYAAMGDLFFDLGNFAVNQALNEEQCEYLLRCYFDE